jgi:hypothetical protein
MAVNVLSNDLGYPGAAAALGLAGVVSAVLWLRRLPSHAPLFRHTTQALLTLAFVLTVAAAIWPGWAPSATVAAAALAVIGVAVVTDLVTVFRLIAGVVGVAFGVALAGLGANTFISRGNLDELVVGVILIVQGVLVIPVVVMLSAKVQPDRDGVLNLGVMGLTGGVAAVGSSAPSGARGWQVDVAVLGIAVFSGGVALLIRQTLVRGAAAVAAGVGLVACGVMTFTGEDVLFGATVTTTGVGIVAAGVVTVLPACHRWPARWARLTGRMPG